MNLRTIPSAAVAAVILLFSLHPEKASAQSPAPAGSSTQDSRASGSGGGAPSVATLSAPTGYILSANDQVAVEVFGEDDLRTNGRLNGEGNLSVPLLGSVHLAGLS